MIHSLSRGGAEQVLVELAAAADGAGLELLVIGLSPADDPVHSDKLRSLGIPVIELDLGRWDLRAITRTTALLRERRIQLVHTHLKHADLVGAAAKARLGLPMVSTLHVIEHATPGKLGSLKRQAGMLARRRFADRTIAVSRSQHDWYRKVAGEHPSVVVLPNGVAAPSPLAPERRAELRRELGAPDGGLLAVSASLMRPEKGHDLLLDALALLPPEVGLTVALAGDGELRAELERHAARLPAVAERVRFLGYRTDVPDLLGAADIVLHTSRADALPTTLIQALAVGVPAIATNVGGIPDIVTSDTGLLVEPRAGAIADALRTLATDPDLRRRMGDAGLERFADRFDSAGWARRLRALYESVLDPSGLTSAGHPSR